MVPGEYSLHVSGFLPDPALTVTVPIFGHLDLILSSGARISGQVLSAAENVPIPEATVSAYDAVAQLYYSELTDENGRYTISGIAPGSYQIEASADAFVPAVMKDISVAEGASVAFSVALERGWSVSGRVLNPQGQPVSGASVSACLTNGVTGKWAVTDNQGHFTLNGLAAGTYHFLANASNYGPAILAAVSVPNQTAGGLNLPLTSSCVVTGTVTDERTGLVLPGATIGSDTMAGTQDPASADALGRFVLQGLPPGPQNIRASAPGYTPQTLSVIAGPAAPATANLALRPSGSIAGQAQLLNGAVLGNVPIALVSSNGTRDVTISSTNGVFQFDDLPDGQYVIALGYPLGMNISQRILSLQDLRNQVVTNLVLAATELRGKVLSSGNHDPIPDVWVELHYEGDSIAHTLTDTNGQYRFLTFGLEAVDLKAASLTAGFLEANQIRLGSNVLQIAPDLVAGSQVLQVNAFRKGTGLPVGGARVDLHPDGGFAPDISFSQLTDSNGKAVFSNLTARAYRVEVTADSFGLESTNLLLAGVSNRVDVALAPGSVLTGTVSDDSGLPVPGALVSLVQMATGQGSQTFADTNGGYEFSWLAEGVYDLWCSAGNRSLLRTAGIQTRIGQTKFS